MTEEQYLRSQLKSLHEAYLLQAQPIIDELVKIECRKPPPPYYVYLHSTWESELLGLPDSVKAVFSDNLPPFDGVKA